MPKKKEPTFEDALERLEEITAHMENGDASLAELVAQRGILLHGQAAEVNHNDGCGLGELFGKLCHDAFLCDTVCGFLFIFGHSINTSHSVPI